MKNTKLFLGVLIAALVLGFASCKQAEGPQDVNVTDMYKSTADYYYKATGSVTVGGTAYTLGGDSRVRIQWSYNKGTDTNVTAYTISGTVQGLASGATAYTNQTISLAFVKINGKIYEQKTDSTTGLISNVDVTSRFTNGSLGDKKFTYTVAAADNNQGSQAWAITLERF